MRLFELFDNPLPYRLMNRSTDQHGSQDLMYIFRVDDFLYKVWLELYPVNKWLAIAKGRAEDVKIPAEFEHVWDTYILSMDFAQFDYGEKTMRVPGRGKIPWAEGPGREGREGSGNELQVFATVATIVKEVYDANRDKIGVIEYGSKEDDPKRKRLYTTMLRKYGITGKTVEMKMATEAGYMQDRVYIILNDDK